MLKNLIPRYSGILSCFFSGFDNFLFREVELLKESLRRAEESQDDPEVVRAKYQETQIQFATHMMSLEELQTLIKMADINLCMRRKGFLTMRGSICRMTANNFSIRLSTRCNNFSK